MLRISVLISTMLAAAVVPFPVAATDPPPCPDAVERMDLEQHIGDELALAGDTAVMASWAGVSTWDLQDSDDPRYVARWIEEAKNSQHNAWRLELDGRGFAYLQEGDVNYWLQPNVEVYDIRDPASPRPISEVVGLFTDFDVAGDILVAVGREFVSVYNVADPFHPRLCGSSEDFNDWQYPFRVVLVAETAYVLGQRYLYVFDVSDCAEPTFVASSDHTVSNPSRRVSKLFHGDDIVGFVGGGFVDDPWGVVWDISDPAAPVRFPWPQAMQPYDATVSGRTAYVATEQGVYVCDLTDLAAPEWLGVVGEGRSWYEVEAQGDRLYAVSSSTLRVFDVSGEPEEVGGTPDPGVPSHFAAEGDVAALARGTYGVTLFDLAAPGLPEMASTVDLDAYANRVELDGRWLYVGLRDPHGIAIVDVADPAAPLHVATMEDASSYATHLAAEGGLLAALLRTPDDDEELRLVDLTTPEAPRVTFTMPLSHLYSGLGVDVADGFVYLAMDRDLVVIDASDPAAAFIVSSTTLFPPGGPNYPSGVAVVDEFAYIAYVYGGLVMVDVTEPATPVVVQSESLLPAHWLSSSAGTVLGASGQAAYLAWRADSGEIAYRRFTVSRWPVGGAIVGGDLYVATYLWLEKVHLECRPPEVDFDWDRTGSWLWPEAHVGYGATSGTWDFGFGEPVEWSPLGVPPVHYPAPGAYDITLELENEWGSDRLTKTVIITPELGLSSPIRYPSGRVAP